MCSGIINDRQKESGDGACEGLKRAWSLNCGGWGMGWGGVGKGRGAKNGIGLEQNEVPRVSIT